MLMSEVGDQAEREYGARFSVKRAQLVKFADYIQKLAFNRDLRAFLVWNAYMTGVTTSLGPYAWPTTIPVRKMLGVTKLTDEQLLGDVVSLAPLSDYGFEANDYDERKMFVKGRHDIFGRTFTFLTTPETAANTYRWIYYRRAPTLTAFDAANDANLILPEEFHQTLMVDGIGALADKATWGEKTPEEVLLPFLQPFWESIAATQPWEGKSTEDFSQGQP